MTINPHSRLAVVVAGLNGDVALALKVVEYQETGAWGGDDDEDDESAQAVEDPCNLHSS